MKEPIQLNLRQIIADRLGSRARWIPGCAISWLERTICQERLNEMLRICHPRRGADFCAGVLDHLGITVQWEHPERLPRDPRAIFICNHPMGGLDGMAIIAALTQHYGLASDAVRFVVNDLLMAVEPLTDVFVPINKHGSQSRRASRDIHDALASDAPVVLFPAGLVSRLGPDGRIADLAWRKSFVPWAISNDRPVVPLYFHGLNSPSFYRIAARRKKTGLKFNYEMIYLPREVFRANGATFRISVGDSVSPDVLASASGGGVGATAMLRARCDALADE